MPHMRDTDANATSAPTERECHLTMPHTHTKKGCVIEKQRGDGMDGDTHLADEVTHTNGVAK